MNEIKVGDVVEMNLKTKLRVVAVDGGISTVRCDVVDVSEKQDKEGFISMPGLKTYEWKVPTVFLVKQ